MLLSRARRAGARKLAPPAWPRARLSPSPQAEPPDGRPMRDRIARSLVWVVWSRGVVQVVSFVSTLVVARLLNPEDYGVMAIAAVWTYIMLMAAELGLGAAILQFRDLDEREINTCFWL